MDMEDMNQWPPRATAKEKASLEYKIQTVILWLLGIAFIGILFQ